jgi:very-short-patch-repair endonuclease
MKRVDRIKKEMKEQRELKLVSPLEDWVYRWLINAKFYSVKREFPAGSYLIDFALVEEKIAIEVDGKQYHSTEEQQAHDEAKDDYLRKNGWRVVRLASNQCWNPKILVQHLKIIFETVYPGQPLPAALNELLDEPGYKIKKFEPIWCEIHKQWEGEDEEADIFDIYKEL